MSKEQIKPKCNLGVLIPFRVPEGGVEIPGLKVTLTLEKGITLEEALKKTTNYFSNLGDTPLDPLIIRATTQE